jgi:hypothetical protein
MGLVGESVVERDIHRCQRAEEIGDDDPYIDVSPRHSQRIVKSTATRALIGEDRLGTIKTSQQRGFYRVSD